MVLQPGQQRMNQGVEQQLLSILADGRFHSGQAIAKALGTTRTSVWKYLKVLQQNYPLEVYAVSGRGYRLASNMDLLQPEALQLFLHEQLGSGFGRLHYSRQIDSTNRYLLQATLSGDTRVDVCTAEMQTAGRGRRGRTWIAGFARNIELSLGFILALPMQSVSGLSLVAAVAMAEWLTDMGIDNVSLKWPNDVLVGGSKLAGILIEVQGEAQGPVKTVLGVGMNIDMSGYQAETIGQDFCDLKTLLSSGLPSRTRLAGELVIVLARALQQFLADGLRAFLDRWCTFDHLMGQQVTLTDTASKIQGTYLGLDESGCLRIHTGEKERQFNAGEVSLRRLPDD